MTELNLGPISPKLMGEYDALLAYKRLSMVKDVGGNWYMAKVDTPAGTALTNTLYWTLFIDAVSNGFDYALPSDPLATTNPILEGATWVNKATGEIFVCTDNTPNSNVWVGNNDLAATKIGSDVTGVTGADTITNIISLTQAEYDAIVTKSASTLYVIVG